MRRRLIRNIRTAAIVIGIAVLLWVLFFIAALSFWG